MLDGLIGKKIGMTQIFKEDGEAVPVTLVQAGPCVVFQKKTNDRDGYSALQLGFVEKVSARRVTRARQGHFAAAGLPPCRVLREFKVSSDDETSVGDIVKLDIFGENDLVDVTGTSRGKGFAGVIRRHGFAGGGASHGSMFHRAPGSIGQSATPSRVFKGMRGPGRMGAKRRTQKNLHIAKVDAANNVLFLRGAVPGAPNGYLLIRRSKKG
ncbi:MAG: 50S ribosomal protein L3 [Acidobacteriota bacterium]